MVLTALRRLLFRHAREWDKVFVESGEEALAELEAGHFDVLVTDMRMPGMDGAALLGHVHERFPDVIRIVLSGQVDQQVALRITPISHQFLSKPCDADTLTGVLDRACALHDLIRDPTVRRLAGEVRDLPTRPRIYARLLDALSNPETSLAQVAAIIEQDVAIAARVLHVVNSAYVASVERISSVTAAVARLGVNRIKFLALTVEVFNAYTGREPPGMSLDALFEHSLTVGTTAMRLLARDRQQAEDAFLAGLLHDVGKLVLLDRAPKRFAALLQEQRRTGVHLHQLERREMGASHAELGAYLLGLWGLPYPLMEAVANHHDPARNAGRGLDTATAVLLANTLTEGKEGRNPDPPLDESLIATLGLPPAIVEIP